MSLQFVNYRGEAVAAFPTGAPKRRKSEPPESFHDGWRVVGIPPGALEEARAQHKADVKAAQTQGTKLPKEWNEQHWLMNARRKPVRAKPYSIPVAAQDCKALAEKSGWLCVEVIEVKKEVQKDLAAS